MTNLQWEILHKKLLMLRSCMVTKKEYKYADSCVIDSKGVDMWIKNAERKERPAGNLNTTWGALMEELNAVYKLTKRDVIVGFTASAYMSSGVVYTPYIPKF